MIKICVLLAIFSLCLIASIVIHTRLVKKSLMFSSGNIIPISWVKECLKRIDHPNERHVYDIIRMVLDLNVCAYGYTGREIISDMNLYPSAYGEKVIDYCIIDSFYVELIEFSPNDSEHILFYEIRILKV